MLCVHIADLHPQRDALAGMILRPTADLEKAVAKVEHQAGCVRAAELPVDGETQSVAIEVVAANEV